MPEGEVQIQIVGDQEYIRITGAGAEVLSGVVRDGDLIDLPIPEDAPPGTTPSKTLRDYKPTAQAWEFPLKSDPLKSPAAFSNEKKLVTRAHPNTGADTDKSQYEELSASMYSGLMAKAVQFIMGYTAKSGIKVKYDHRWARCHGVAIAADGAKWLVEISLVNGVIAMPFPLLPNSAKYKTSTQDVLREIALLFEGLPSGTSFPPAERLDAAITSGEVVRLMSVAAMEEVFTKETFSPLLGWAFSPLGDEAQNTCYKVSGGGDVTSYRYRLALTIGPKLVDRPENTPLAMASANLTLEEEGPLTRRDGSPERRVPFAFAYDFSGLLVEPPAKFVASDPVATSAPLLATFDQDGVLDVVRFEVVVPEVSDNSTTGDACSTLGYLRPGGYRNRRVVNIAGGRTITSTKYPLREGTTGTIYTSNTTKYFVGTRIFYGLEIVLELLFSPSIWNLIEYHRLYYMADEVYSSRTIPAVAGVWPLGARDCYVMSKPGDGFWDYHARLTGGDPTTDSGGEGNFYFTYRNATYYTHPRGDPSSYPTMTVTKGVRSDVDPCLWNYVGSSDFATEGLVGTAAWYAETDPLPRTEDVPLLEFPPELNPGPPGQDPDIRRVVTPTGTTEFVAAINEAGVWRFPLPIYNTLTNFAVRYSSFGPNPQLTASYSALGYLYPGVEHAGSMLASEGTPADHSYSFIGYI